MRMACNISLWLATLYVLCWVASGKPESLLCGPTQELKLLTSGRTSAVALTLANREGNSSEPCSLNIFAPDAYALGLRIIDAKDFDITTPWTINWSLNILGFKKNKPQPPDCTLQIFNFDAKKPNKKSNLLKVTPCSSKYPPLEMLPPPIRIEWWPPRPPKSASHLRLVVTAINSGAICDGSDQVVCLSAGKKPLFCVSDTLACDGVKHCPEGAEDESTSRCGRKKFSWIDQLVRRVLSKHGDFLNIDESQFTAERNVSTNTTVAPKKKSVIAAFEAALEPYGPWSHMLVGILISAVAVALFTMWECLCHRAKPPQAIPPECEAPAAVILDTPRCSSRPAVVARANGPPPPSYDTIEPPPPSYSFLFPQEVVRKPADFQIVQEASTSSSTA